MECGRLIPFPVREPIAASNGIAVAHPIDLMAAKIEACINRGEQRDYEDIASAFSAWPGWVNSAISALPSRSAGAIGRALASPPIEVEFELNAKTLKQLRNQARKLGYGERGVNP